MKKRNVLIITLLSMFMTTGFVACKHGHHSGGFDKFDLEAAVNRIASRLDLDESQKADLEKITTEIAAKAKEMHGDRKAHHKEIASKLSSKITAKAFPKRPCLIYSNPFFGQTLPDHVKPVAMDWA